MFSWTVDVTDPTDIGKGAQKEEEEKYGLLPNLFFWKEKYTAMYISHSKAMLDCF